MNHPNANSPARQTRSAPSMRSDPPAEMHPCHRSNRRGSRQGPKINNSSGGREEKKKDTTAAGGGPTRRDPEIHRGRRAQRHSPTTDETQAQTNKAIVGDNDRRGTPAPPPRGRGHSGSNVHQEVRMRKAGDREKSRYGGGKGNVTFKGDVALFSIREADNFPVGDFPSSAVPKAREREKLVDPEKISDRTTVSSNKFKVDGESPRSRQVAHERPAACAPRRHSFSTPPDPTVASSRYQRTGNSVTFRRLCSSGDERMSNNNSRQQCFEPRASASKHKASKFKETKSDGVAKLNKDQNHAVSKFKQTKNNDVARLKETKNDDVPKFKETKNDVVTSRLLMRGSLPNLPESRITTNITKRRNLLLSSAPKFASSRRSGNNVSPPPVPGSLMVSEANAGSSQRKDRKKSDFNQVGYGNMPQSIRSKLAVEEVSARRRDSLGVASGVTSEYVYRIGQTMHDPNHSLPFASPLQASTVLNKLPINSPLFVKCASQEWTFAKLLGRDLDEGRMSVIVSLDENGTTKKVLERSKWMGHFRLVKQNVAATSSHFSSAVNACTRFDGGITAIEDATRVSSESLSWVRASNNSINDKNLMPEKCPPVKSVTIQHSATASMNSNTNEEA